MNISASLLHPMGRAKACCVACCLPAAGVYARLLLLLLAANGQATAQAKAWTENNDDY